MNKRKIIFGLILCISLSSIGCGGKNKKSFEMSNLAYENINAAYEGTEQLGSDIYEAWRLGIYDDEELVDGGVEYLSAELSLSEEELIEGIVYSLISITNETYETASEEDKEELRKSADLYFVLFKDELFSACVECVKNAYIANGTISEIQSDLDEAKGQMKILSEKYSDYEHYPNLKGFYTTTSSFFDFCQNPTGSFEQIKNTVNDYKNEARDYKNDLDYIFEE